MKTDKSFAFNKQKTNPEKVSGMKIFYIRKCILKVLFKARDIARYPVLVFSPLFQLQCMFSEMT